MRRRLICALLAVALLAAAVPNLVVTAQVLDYERGWLFFTTGDGFRVDPNVVITGGAPHARDYARVTFNDRGVVTSIVTSRTKLAPQGDFSAVHKFAVALSPAAPNPDLRAPAIGGRCTRTRPGKTVGLTVTVQVPPSTPPTDTVYMTSDQSGWNAQAYRLDRFDALHYRATLRLYSGTVLHVLFDRGSTQSLQVAENGMDAQPYLLCIGDEDAQAFRVVVYRWSDEQAGQTQQAPQALPTPYNPAPFPNLPTPAPARLTAHTF